MRAALLACVVIGTMLIASCYSFKGGSVPSHLKTVAIPLFDDQSGSAEPGLREKFTAKLLDRFRQDNSLQVADRSHADAVIEGTILSAVDEPYVVAQGESVTKWRVTITVKASFQDLKFKKQTWEKQFSNFALYETSGGPGARLSGFQTTIDKLSEDILNESVSGW